MKIQSLSIAVPAGCLNNCKFCVSRLHPNPYKNRIDNTDEYTVKDFQNRLQYASAQNIDTVIFTGTGEPTQNMEFIDSIMQYCHKEDLFYRFEIQTSGVSLEEKLSDIRKMGINVISLSLSNIFHSQTNALHNGTPKDLQVDIDDLCKKIVGENFTLRLVLNMTSDYDDQKPQDVIDRASSLGANQLTIRSLYDSNDDSKQSKWIQKNRCDETKLIQISQHIRSFGRPLHQLPFGAMVRSINDISTIVDDDCMHTINTTEHLKYFILREDCHLYSRWDDKGSIIY